MELEESQILSTLHMDMMEHYVRDCHLLLQITLYVLLPSYLIEKGNRD